MSSSENLTIIWPSPFSYINLIDNLYFYKNDITFIIFFGLFFLALSLNFSSFCTTWMQSCQAVINDFGTTYHPHLWICLIAIDQFGTDTVRMDMELLYTDIGEKFTSFASLSWYCLRFCRFFFKRVIVGMIRSDRPEIAKCKKGISNEGFRQIPLAYQWRHHTFQRLSTTLRKHHTANL